MLLSFDAFVNINHQRLHEISGHSSKIKQYKCELIKVGGGLNRLQFDPRLKYGLRTTWLNCCASK
jgi:hypothetical protein